VSTKEAALAAVSVTVVVVCAWVTATHENPNKGMKSNLLSIRLGSFGE